MQWQLRLPLALGALGLVCLLGATASADAPHVFVLEWGSLGSGNGQFRFPLGVATDGAGDVYVSPAPKR